jgi:hypothetical protein
VTGAYRVRYTSGPVGRVRAADVLTADVSCELDDLPAALPPGSYVLSVEDLAGRRDVHWTRWPKAFRPGARDESTGRVLT